MPTFPTHDEAMPSEHLLRREHNSMAFEYMRDGTGIIQATKRLS
jgi:hypothetical protein